jgi:hypothetical protein
VNVDIVGCARCGENHGALEFMPLTNHARYTWWAMCPRTEQPLLMREVEAPAEDEAPT